MTDDFPSTNFKDEDAQFILQRQYSNYREIRDSTSQIFQLVLSVASLVASIGFLQLLLSENAGVARLSVGMELANRCAPEALAYSGVSLRGLGPINYWLVGGLLILVIHLIGEMWYVNFQSRSLPALKPQSELELYVYDYADFLEQNRIHLKRAQEYLFAMKSRLYYASTLYGVSVLLLINLYYSYTLSLLVADATISVFGFGFLIYWVYQYIRIDGWEFSDWGTRGVSIPFIFLFAIVVLFLIHNMYQIFLLLDYFFIC